MTDQTITPIANPYMEQTHYGIPVASLSDDGDLIALGHHDDDKALEAFRAHLALPFTFGERITRGWAVFHKPAPGHDGWEDEEYVWVAEPATADTPGALAVTRLEA
jgi:hypothetical protein